MTSYSTMRTGDQFGSINGKTKTLSEWLRRAPISRQTFYNRKAKGWTDVDALFYKANGDT